MKKLLKTIVQLFKEDPIGSSVDLGILIVMAIILYKAAIICM